MSGDPHRRLIRALLPHAGSGGALVASRTIPWASATFAGMRHRLTFAVSGADHLSGLAPETIALPGHLLVEMAEKGRRIEGAATLVEIDALTVEAG